MEMALLNVLINSRDAMPNGGKVTIATAILNDKDRIAAHHLPPGSYVMICIMDEGEGMSPEVAQRATEPFFTTKGPGTGLGLAMVHGFVQQSHGSLEISSEPGKGTTVRMIFPLAVERTISPKPEDIPSLVAEPPASPQTILLVEDSDDVRQVADIYLRSLGYRVLAARSGEEALEMMDQYGPIDLLFTDVMMPGGINGLVLAERVRKRFPTLPVLLTSGYMDEIARPGVDTSTMSILNKPYRQTELADRIRAALNHSDAASRPNSPNFLHEG
jgi:CheY-like chemotaxis protein